MRRQPAADYAVIKLAPDEGMQLIADGHFTIEIGVFIRDETGRQRPVQS